MPRKTSLLDAMRAARDEREREAVAPVAEKLTVAQQDAASTRSRLRSVQDSYDALGRVVSSEYGKEVVGAMRERAARDFMPTLMEALTQTRSDDVVTVQIPASVLRWLSPSKAQQQILEQAAHQIDRLAAVKSSRDWMDGVTHVTITVPSFTIRQVVMDDAIEWSARRRRA